MKSVPFLWEIGCEEIPADWLPGVTEQLRRLFARSLEGAGLGKGVVEVYGTPRRLVVHVPELQEKQPHRREEITGPPLRIARTAGGKWSRAACGFARKNRIDPKKLVVIRKEKGEYVGFVREVKGLAAFKLLPSLMASTLRELRFPKFMSWDAELPDGRGAFPFGRPIRWMICVLGGRVVPFEIRGEEKGKVKAGKYSRGHRFLAPPRKRPGARFAATSFRELKQGLERHYVLLDSAERRARIEKALQRVEKKAKAKRAAGLSVDLVANLVEWPGSVLGTYPDEFLSLPEEVRHTVLIHHQKYFPLMGKPAFVAVTNMASDPKGFIRKGSERVVAARLRDAKFFWEEDLKKRLIERKPRLQGVVFHEKLGTYRDKVERMVALARWLAQRAGLPSGPVERAAELAKCDLTTAMVGEFPELQGIMGGLYAREQGEPEEVWKAVYSHYRPVGLGEDEDFPLNREGALVSLADKLDTLTGMFSVGEAPTGSSDPFGLRRI
ncbi:MAG: glycine--tRNA ligase subunit beta, partial [Acidobacteriota bacterium]